MSPISRVLVIDDDPSVRDMIREVLEGEGHEISVAEDGVAGSLLFQRMPFDLVITDIVMPNQDGLETIRVLHRERPDLPILAISGGGRYAWNDVLETAALFGASQTLSKPFSVQALVTAVRDLLRNPSQEGLAS